MYKRLLLSCLTLILSSETMQAVQSAWQVTFTNKSGTRPFSDSSTFLSARSLARRALQGITLDSTDLPVTQAYIDSAINLTNGKLHETSKWFNFCVILVTDSNAIHALAGQSFIASVKLVGYYADSLHKPAQAPATPLPTANKTTTDATYYSLTWDQTIIVKGNYLHNIGYKGTGKLIAVLDGGFSGTNTHAGFSNLYSTGRLTDVHNFVLNTGNVYAYDNHGTEVLSTMAGDVPNTYVGSAPLASYALYVTEAPGEQPIELLNMVCAMERADSLGADIVSSSLGYNTFDNTADNLNYATHLDGKTTIAAKGVNTGTAKGMLFVITAGNEGVSSWRQILTPGDADSALTIGNVNVLGNIAPNSGFGPNAAGRVKPDVCGMGEPGAVFNFAGGYTTASGTSIATPEIAGWAACLWQAAPHSTPAQLRKAITQCASRYTTPGTQIGFGIPDFQCAATSLNVLDTQVPDASQVIAITNPVSNSLTLSVTLATAQTITMKLINMEGRTYTSVTHYFLSGTNPPFIIDVTHLPPGIYFLKATSAQNARIIKIVKY